MVVEKQISRKIKELSPRSKEEVLDFIEFVLMKQTKSDGVIATPVFGCAKKHSIEMTSDFDEPLSDFEVYMK